MTTAVSPVSPFQKVVSALRRLTRALFAPGAGLILTWLALTIAAGVVLGPVAANTVMMGGFTFILLLMLAVAACMPPTKPFRELSALAARTADLIKVSSGAALFGAAAAYGGIVGAVMSRMPLEEMMSPYVIWSFIWPVLLVASMFGASVVGLRLGWDFRFSRHRARLVALGKLRSVLPARMTERRLVTNWAAHVFVVASRSGFLMVVGYLTPLIITGDVFLGIEYAKLLG